MRRRASGGFSLVEALVGLFILLLGMLAVIPLFVGASRTTAAGADLGSVGAAAVQRMEILRRTDYAALAAGGDLSTNVTGYTDGSIPDVVVRWRITNGGAPPYLKTIDVRAIASKTRVGLPKEIVLSSLRAQ